MTHFSSTLWRLNLTWWKLDRICMCSLFERLSFLRAWPAFDLFFQTVKQILEKKKYRNDATHYKRLLKLAGLKNTSAATNHNKSLSIMDTPQLAVFCQMPWSVFMSCCCSHAHCVAAVGLLHGLMNSRRNFLSYTSSSIRSGWEIMYKSWVGGRLDSEKNRKTTYSFVEHWIVQSH